MNKQPKTFARIAAATAAALACASQASAQTNLLADGDFEALTHMVADGLYAPVAAGNYVGAWLVGGDSIELLRNRPSSGTIDGISIDLAGANAGSLSQSFTAEAGTTYTLSWDYFKNLNGLPLSVTIGDQTMSYAPPSVVTSASLNFTATSSGMQTVTFAAVGTSNRGPVLDNVSLTVSAVPEPETYAILLAGLGAVGFVARRRKTA